MTLLIERTQHVIDPSMRVSLEYGCDAYNNFLTDSTRNENLLTPAEKKSLFEYTGWFYRDYQSYLKNPSTVTPSPVVKESLQFMDSALAKSPRKNNNVLYHGVPKDLQNSMSMWSDPNFITTNDTFVRESFFSTSIDPKVASDNTGGGEGSIIFEIYTTDGLALNGELSEHGLREKEVLLPRGKQFKIIGVLNNVVFSWGSTSRTHTIIQLEDLS